MIKSEQHEKQIQARLVTDTDEEAYEDALYPDVVQFVVGGQRVSISSIQRKFETGYNRSAHLVERMEQNGVVSAPSYNGGREVLVTA